LLSGYLISATVNHARGFGGGDTNPVGGLVVHIWGGSVKRVVKSALAATAIAAAMVGAAIAPAYAWVTPGRNVQYPAEGGIWEYGFWNAKLRSYYTVNRCHGSTVVKYNDGSEVARSRSVDTAAGRTSIAELTAVNTPGLSARYYYRTC